MENGTEQDMTAEGGSPPRSESAKRSNSRSPSGHDSRKSSRSNSSKRSASVSRSKSGSRSPSRSRSASGRRSASRSGSRSRSGDRSHRKSSSHQHSHTEPCSLLVRGFRGRVERQDIDYAFSKYGRVTDIHIPRDFHTHEQRGFAFIEFEDKRDGEEALKKLDGQNVAGYEVSVTIAKNRRKTPDEMRKIYGDHHKDSSRSRSRSSHRSRYSHHDRSRSRSRKDHRSHSHSRRDRRD